MTDDREIERDSPFWLGDWYVEPSTGRIQRQGDKSQDGLKLEPKVMTVLLWWMKQKPPMKIM